jgi:predicted house-cleaning noncanonical NTP pyrophosphatase (MazG superfamily)
MDRPSRDIKLSDMELMSSSSSAPPASLSSSAAAAALPPIEDSGRDVDTEAIRYAARAAADLKRATLSEYKESMEQEAKKISSAYLEVQQKHDLAMRLEQVTSLNTLLHYGTLTHDSNGIDRRDRAKICKGNY